ncbi:MAG: hypothetical protein ACOY3Z_10765 [Thermodesulfobacteriota bacterium]
MVITEEIKFPRPIRVDPYRAEKKVAPVDGTPVVSPVGAFRREWQRSREERHTRGREELPPRDEATIRRLLAMINSRLEARGILIHLVLIRDQSGYSIDVYDCTGNERCAIVGDVVVELADLEALLRHLEQESGILLDTIS